MRDSHLHDIRALSAATTPDRQVLLAASGREGITIWNVDRGEVQLRIDDENVYALAWHQLPNGRMLLASGSWANAAKIWDGATGECLAELAHPDDVNDVDLVEMPDGRLVLTTACDDGQVRIFSTDVPAPAAGRPASAEPPEVTFEPSRTLEAHDRSVWSVEFGTHADGSAVIISAGSDSAVRLWDGQTGRPRLLMGSRDTGYQTALAEDGRLVAGTGEGSATRIWDTDSGTLRHEFTDPGVEWSEAVACTTGARGQTLVASGGSDGAVRIRDGHTGRLLRTITTENGPVRSLRWHVAGDQEILAIGWSYGIAHVLDLGTGEVLDLSHGNKNENVHLSSFVDRPDGQLVIAAIHPTVVQTWDVRARSLLRSFPHGEEDSRAIACLALADGRVIIATTGWSRNCRIWDLDSGELLQTLTHDANINAVDLAALPDGRVALATAGGGGAIRLWTSNAVLVAPPGTVSAAAAVPTVVDDRTPEPIRALDKVTHSVALFTHASGPILLAAVGKGDNSGWEREWDVGSGSVLYQHDQHASAIRSVAWAAATDGRTHCVIGRDDGTVLGEEFGIDGAATAIVGLGRYLWNAESGPVRSLSCVSSEPLRVAVCGPGHTVGMWNLTTESSEWQFSCGDDWGAAFHSADEHVTVASFGSGPAVTLWNGWTGNPLRTLAGSGGAVQHAAFAEPTDGQPLLVTGAADGIAQVWDVQSGESQRTVRLGGAIVSVSCRVLTDGTVLVAAALADPARIELFDARSGARLHTLDLAELSRLSSVALGQRQDGTVLLAAGGDRGVRLLEVRLGTQPVPDGRGLGRAERGAVVTLGSAGMWRPLGLVTDLVRLTAPDGTTADLIDPRLTPLANHPGTGRLRALDWPPPARLALAALLAAPAPELAPFVPPSGSGPYEQLAVLDAALRAHTGPASTPGVNYPALLAAAGAVTARTVALLRIIGPDAATLDPLLPLRLAHHASGLPELSPPQLTLLGRHTDSARPRTSAASTLRSAGSVGVTRSGPLTTVLLTEHALPKDLFAVRLAAGQLQHRHHPANPRPARRPLTLVLDTTPPTFGPPESVLRTLAHLITEELWAAGCHPLLITLTDPGHACELHGPADLPALWTSRTLRQPDLSTALRTAASTAPYPTLTLTTHHHAGYHPRAVPQHQLLTTHQPGHPPRHLPATPGWHHIAPDADPATLAATVVAILAAAPTRRTA